MIIPPYNQDFHEVKAFTQQGMKVIGNPATVTIVDEFPDDETMGLAARQLASPMTTFVRPTETPGVFDIRHFSPDGDECHVCGHATMAATEYLLSQYPEFRQNGDLTFRMNPKFGVSDKSEIRAKIDGDNISLTMPAIIGLQPIQDPEFYRLLSEALRVPEDELLKPAYFAPRVRDIVVGFKTQEVLLSLEPDFAKLKDMALKGNFIHEGMMCTSKSDIGNFDIVNRVFLPGIDVNEDVACGSANCSIIPYWVVHNKTFDADKRDFKVVYPYPPGGAGYVGGIQDLNLNVEKAEIILTGQASYAQKINVQLPARTASRDKNNGLTP